MGCLFGLSGLRVGAVRGILGIGLYRGERWKTPASEPTASPLLLAFFRPDVGKAREEDSIKAE